MPDNKMNAAERWADTEFGILSIGCALIFTAIGVSSLLVAFAVYLVWYTIRTHS